MPKYIEYDGLMFCRDEKTGYYLNSTIRKRLHRYVWEKEVGAIPKGYHVHHIDGNKDNNCIDNLSIMTASGHVRLHGQEERRKAKSRENVKKAIAAAPAWHASEAGKDWHSRHMRGFKHKKQSLICVCCGKQFVAVSGKFCSNACKAKSRRDSGVDNVERMCKLCGKPFMANKYSDIAYCSKECGHKAHVGWYERKRVQE